MTGIIKDGRYRDREWLWKKYITEKCSALEIARTCDCVHSRIQYWLTKYNFPRRTRSEVSKLNWKLNGFRENHKKRMQGNKYGWRGGRMETTHGYIALYMPQHPNRYNKQYVYEHVVKAVQALGRPLKKGECVHHINGIKGDNRNKNLLICTLSYHRWLESRMAHLYKKKHLSHI